MRLFLKPPFLFVLSSLSFLMGFVYFIETTPKEPIIPYEKTDLIVVLTGGKGRIYQGLNLFYEKKAPMLLISGVKKGTPFKAIIGASGYKGFLNTKKIILDYDSTTTLENAKNVSKWCQKNGIKSIHLVTATYHMKRSLINFNHYMKNVLIIPHAVAPLDYKYQKWFYDHTVFLFYVTEYLKYLGAFFRSHI